jgi:hypothetical protein
MLISFTPRKTVLDRLAFQPRVRPGLGAIQAFDAALTFLCIAHRSSNAISAWLRFNRFIQTTQGPPQG